VTSWVAKPGPLAEQRGGGARQVGTVARAEDHEARVPAVAGRVEPEHRAGADEREVPVPARDLGEAVPRPGRGRARHLDLREQLVGLERGGQEAADEVLRSARPPRPGVSKMKDGVEGDHAGGQLGGGVGVGQAAPDGAARSRLQVPDERGRLGEKGRGGRDAPVALERVLPDERAQAEAPRVLPQRPERGHAVQVHDHRGPHQPHVHHRHQALAAGQELGLVAVAGEEIERLLHRPRREVFEGSGAHATRARPSRASGDRTAAGSRPTAPSGRGSS
jgi:hypothetical protein